jgi:LDH2 family malate/lactate/ureidoglycolate dehydrogenase
MANAAAGIRVAPKRLQTFSAELLQANGCDAEQAGVMAEILVWCNRIDRPNQGVWRLPLLCRRLQAGLIAVPCRPQVTQCAPGIHRMDGNGGFGHYVAARAMQHTITNARISGIAMTAVHNSNFFGAAGYYADQAARAGMLGLAMSNSFPKVAPHGGVLPALGTNPMAFAAPRRSGETLLLDMSTSASAGSTVTKRAEDGGALPEGIAIDKQGRPITDPSRVADGALLPFGGAKGFGLSLMVEILSGVISGAGFSHEVRSMYKDFERSGDNGHFFMAIDVEKLMPLQSYYARVDQLVDYVKASTEGFADRAITLPGEARWRAQRESEDAVALDAATQSALLELAAASGLQAPWQD